MFFLAPAIISGPVELVWPPFVNLALSFRIMLFPLLILVAMLALLDEGNEMGKGLKRLWRLGQERVEVDRSEAGVGKLRRVPYTIRAD